MCSVPAIEGEMSPEGGCRNRILDEWSYQLSAISYQLPATSYQLRLARISNKERQVAGRRVLEAIA